MPHFSSQELIGIAARFLRAAGAPPEAAAQVAASLVLANLTGHDSHGVIRLVQYGRAIRNRQIDPLAEIEIVQDTPTTAVLDAHWAFGQIAARRAMEIAIEKARACHLGAVALRNSAHVGRLGEYALMAVEHGMIGFLTCNSSLLTAPYGGADRVFGTNPFAYAIPSGGQPLLVDFATTPAAEGKLRVALAQGRPIPEGWILDKARQPTTDPADFYDGGVLLPLGGAAGHKGYGLLLVADLLGGALTGHGCTALPEHTTGNGVFLMAIDIEAFRPLAEMTENVDRLFAHVRASQPAPGFDEILIPGDPEFRTQARREAEGIDVPATTWRDIIALAAQFGLNEDELVGEE
jgi:LDH2 family malate/lactate/ureidoglycolate dehydrogenase